MRCTWSCAAFVLATMFFSACASKPAELLLDTKLTNPKTVIALVRQHQDKVRTLVGKGSVTFESPEMAGTAAFELALKKPDSLLVTFEGPFGLDLGMLFLSSGKYLVYNSLENRVVTGVPSAAAIRSIIPFDLTLDQVVSAFSGSFPFPLDVQSPETYSVDDDMFLLSFNCGTRKCRYWVDNQTALVRKYEIRDGHGELVMDATSSSFIEDGDVSTPKRIRVRFPADGRQLSVSYSTISLDDPSPSFDFSIPANARTTTR